MSSKKFILCSDFQPMPEFAKETVMYFNPNDPQGLADKINSILDNEELQKQFAFKSFEESKNYSWENTSDKTWESLYSVI